jgi:2-phosphosulfolactate phosphatase
MNLDVLVAPSLLSYSSEGLTLCAVIDVLRAATTVITALANGAAEIRPCVNAEEARNGMGLLRQGACLLGGEEMGQRIRGFDLGNSPLEYLDSSVIAGKIIFFATTNATPVIRRAYTVIGSPIYITALINTFAVSSAIATAALDTSCARVILLCCGQHGQPSVEDLFCAGIVAHSINQRLLEASVKAELSDAALIAMEFAEANEERAYEVLSRSEHGRYLQRIGFAKDLEFACHIDTSDIVPVFDGKRILAQPI